MATVAGLNTAGIVAVTGAGYSANERVVLTMSFVSTDNKRRTNEMRSVTADALGAIVLSYTVPFATGLLTVKAHTGTNQATLAATSTGVSV